MGAAVKSVVAREKANRRRYPRVPVNRPARIRVAGGPPAPCQLMNISSRGAALFYSTALDPGTLVWLRISLPGSRERLTLKLVGVVRQAHLLGESHLIRVAFTNPPLPAVRAILEFMQSRDGSTVTTVELAETAR
jgi:hypothetical protein